MVFFHDSGKRPQMQKQRLQILIRLASIIPALDLRHDHIAGIVIFINICCICSGVHKSERCFQCRIFPVSFQKLLLFCKKRLLTGQIRCQIFLGIPLYFQAVRITFFYFNQMSFTDPVSVKSIVYNTASATPDLLRNDITVFFPKNKLPSLWQRFSFIKHPLTSIFSFLPQQFCHFPVTNGKFISHWLQISTIFHSFLQHLSFL